MELPGVDNLCLDETTTSVLKDIDETARRVNELRRLSPQVIEAVQRELLGGRVHNSNAIEGNPYGLRETVEILRTGHIDIAQRREATEVINLGRVIEHAQQLDVPSSRTVDEFLRVHEMLLHGIRDDWAGRFRDESVVLTGAKHQPPDPRYVSGLVEGFFDRLRRVGDVSAVVLATWVHWTIARIHPFFDANGRMARLWQDIILFQHQLTCAIIRPQDRTAYMSALEAADDGDFNPLTQLIAQRVAATLDGYLSAQQSVDAMSAWARELVGETSARAEQRRKLAYLRWTRKVEELRNAFQRCAATITHASVDTEVQFRPYDIIDQAAWENIRAGSGASQTWFFTLGFRRGPHLWRYFFFFGKHFWSDLDTDTDRPEPHVCLLISEQPPGHQQGQRLGAQPGHSLSIRELFVVDNSLVRKRFDAAQQREVYDRGIDAMTVAQEFIRDVLLLRMS